MFQTLKFFWNSDWSLAAVARGLALHGRFSMRHVGSRRGLAAYDPDDGGRPVRGLLVLAHGHYTARLRRPDGSVVKLDPLHPSASVEMTGAEIDADLDLHRCAYRIEEGADEDDEGAGPSDEVLQQIDVLQRVPVDVPAGLWALDAADTSSPRLVWVPASDLDASVYTLDTE